MTPIYFIVAIALLIWGTIFVMRGSLVGGCLAFVIAASCFGYHFLNFDLGPIPLTVDRLVLAALLVIFVVHWRQGKTDRKPLEYVDILLAGFIGLLTISTMLNLELGAMPELAKPWTRLLGAYVIPAVVYAIARLSPIDRRKVSLIQGTLVCLGAYLAITGLLEITGQWWAVFPKHIADPSVGIHFGRARGPMVQSVSYGFFVGVCLLATLAWQWRFDRRGHLVLWILLPVMAAGVFYSYTRSVWMGTALGLLIVLGLTLRGKWRPLVLGSMLVAGMLLAVTKMDKLVEFNRGESSSHARSSVDLRGTFAYLSWQMFLDRPLLGAGFDQFRNAKLPYLSDRESDYNLETVREWAHHNTLLSLLTETGLVGLSLFMAVLGGWGWAAWKIARNRTMPDWARAQGALMLGVLGVYICQAAFHELSYTPIDNSLVFCLAGLTVGLCRLEPDDPKHSG
jgi:O-antigen ligase